SGIRSNQSDCKLCDTRLGANQTRFWLGAANFESPFLDANTMERLLRASINPDLLDNELNEINLQLIGSYKPYSEKFLKKQIAGFLAAKKLNRYSMMLTDAPNQVMRKRLKMVYKRPLRYGQVIRLDDGSAALVPTQLPL